MPRGPQMSTDIRGEIIGMARCNKSAREIGRELGIPHTTVTYTNQRFKKTGANVDMPRFGRPTILTERGKNHLARTVKANRFKSLREIINQEPVNVSVDTA